MANWQALRNYIQSRYTVADDRGNIMRLLFELDGGRSQTVFVSKCGEIEGGEWADVWTPVAKESQVSLRDLMLRNSQTVVGGLGLLDDGTVIFRHSFPLADLDASEFEAPLSVAVLFGDRLEHELTGRDVF
jgi:hypothetical protein